MVSDWLRHGWPALRRETYLVETWEVLSEKDRDTRIDYHLIADSIRCGTWNPACKRCRSDGHTKFNGGRWILHLYDSAIHAYYNDGVVNLLGRFWVHVFVNNQRLGFWRNSCNSYCYSQWQHRFHDILFSFGNWLHLHDLSRRLHCQSDDSGDLHGNCVAEWIILTDTDRHRRIWVRVWRSTCYPQLDYCRCLFDDRDDWIHSHIQCCQHGVVYSRILLCKSQRFHIGFYCHCHAKWQHGIPYLYSCTDCRSVRLLVPVWHNTQPFVGRNVYRIGDFDRNGQYSDADPHRNSDNHGNFCIWTECRC